ncbi:MAG: cytochrome c biogenesis protein ResB, partial [Limnobacter sp.]|nr:cytochrome c biogenesis protein ResB [Limnobacter sp.]
MGYIATHVSIVVICVGGLLDSGVPLKLAVWATGKQPVSGAALANAIPESARLGVANPSYRANLFLPEGKTSRVALLNTDSGVLVQDLPFDITLEQFRIDFYSTGMPKLFASDVKVHDPQTGKTFRTSIEVNKPLVYKGVTVYQSSFDDGGTQLVLQGIGLLGYTDHRFTLKGEVGGALPLPVQDTNQRHKAGEPLSRNYRVEFTEFKAINVENMPARAAPGTTLANAQQASTPAPPSSDFMQTFQNNLASVTGPGVNSRKDVRFKNVGPSFAYKLRDESGQAREYKNYMLPIELEGASYLLTGMRTTPAEPFQYLRIPADEQGGINGFMSLRAALQNPALRAVAARRFALNALDTKHSGAYRQLLGSLESSALRALNTFAGDGKGSGPAGLQAVADFIQARVPEAERQQATDVIVRILQGVMWQL